MTQKKRLQKCSLRTNWMKSVVFANWELRMIFLFTFLFLILWVPWCIHFLWINVKMIIDIHFKYCSEKSCPGNYTASSVWIHVEYSLNIVWIQFEYSFILALYPYLSVWIQAPLRAIWLCRQKVRMTHCSFSLVFLLLFNPLKASTTVTVKNNTARDDTAGMKASLWIRLYFE